jgi:hypothetical protein
MDVSKRIDVFARLGEYLRSMKQHSLHDLSEKAAQENPWFTEEQVSRAIRGIARFLDRDILLQWTRPYSIDHDRMRTVAIVMAGNIPLVGFHDLLCVLVSGHRALVKMSSKDTVLTKFIAQKLIELEPQLEHYIALTDGQLKAFDAVIATGSDNAARYFSYYFKRYPHIIRKNRVSVAVLSGSESMEKLEQLGEDVFSYFGLGCRNVSKLFLPSGYDLEVLYRPWKKFEHLIHHHRYANNYDYQKSILLVNRQPFTDFGFVLLKETEDLVSPVSMIYVEYYSHREELMKRLEASADKIQCIVAEELEDSVPFGQAQFPDVWDYADRIDTMRFLENLSR